MATPGDVDRLLALMTPTLGRGGVPLPTPSIDPQFGGEGDAAHPGGQFGTRSLSPGGVPVGDLNAIVGLMGRSSVPSMAMPSLEDRAAGIFNRSVAGDPLLSRAGMIGQMGPGGGIAGMPQFGGRFGRFAGNQNFGSVVGGRLNNLELEAILKARFGPNAFLRGNEFPVTQGSSHGPSSADSAAAQGMTATAGQTAGPNTGGVESAAQSAAAAVAAGFGALGGEGLTAGFNASPNAAENAIGTGGYGMASPVSATGLSQGQVSDAEAVDSASAVTGVLGGVQSIGITSDGQTVSVNTSTGVVSVGGDPVGVVGGGSGGGGVGGGGIGGGDAGGIGMDGSSNAGIGGPGGTGAAGGVGAAAGEGAGTGGVGEGEMYGGHFTVGGDPRAGPDSMNVRFKASPGEHVVVVPQGMTPGQILARPEQISTWRMTGNRPNPGPGPTPGMPVPPGTPVNSPGGIEALLAHMKATPGRR